MHGFLRIVRPTPARRFLLAALLAAFGFTMPALGAPTSRVLDSGGVGEYSSLALDSFGFPVISYYDRANGNLKLARCDSVACLSPVLATVDADPADVGQFSSLQLTSAGHPAISYFDANGFDPSLRLALCADSTCSASTTLVLDNAGFQPVGRFTSLQLRADAPVVAYFDQNAGGRLMYVRCIDATCGAVAAPVALDDPANLLGSLASLQLNASGNAVVSYYDDFNGDLKLATCGDVDCSTVTTAVLDGGGVNSGLFSSLQLAGGVNPVISHFDQTNGVLRLLACADPACASISFATLDYGGEYSSMRLDGNGFPIIAYRAASGLKLAVCHDTLCSASTLSTVDAGDVGFDASLALGADGLPFISHYSVAGSLKLTTFTRAAVASVSVPPAGNYTTGSTLELTVNTTENVTVSGTPRLQVDIGGTVREADFVSGSGTSALVFSYTVDAADQDVDGIALGAILFNSAVLHDANGFGMDIALNLVGTTDGVKVNAPWSVTPSAGPNGTINPDVVQLIAQGDMAVFTVTPDFKFAATIGGTCPAGTFSAPTYTSGPITADCTVAATFNQVLFTATPSVGSNGAIVEGAQTLAAGDAAVFTVNPSPGYTVIMGGTCGGSLMGNVYTTAPLAADCTVEASFVSGAVTTFTGATATGTGAASVAISGGGATCGFAPQGNGPLQSAFFIPVEGHPKSPPAGTSPTVAFTHGLLDFVLLNCTPGSTVSFTVTYPSAVPVGTQYFKYGPTPSNPTPHWYVLPATFAGNTATFTITDGGLGDDDLAANGTIVDQGGPGAPGGAAIPVPTLSPWALLLLALLAMGTAAPFVRREEKT